MEVSILIATYGGGEWEKMARQRALPSTENQGALEVLVGHDPEGTIAGVRNALAEKAKGEWLCFLDADDQLASGYLDAMEQAGGGDGPSRLLTPSVQRMRKGRPAGRPSFYQEQDLLKANWLVVGTLLERSLFEYVGGFEDYPHGFEDWSLWNKCARAGATVVKVPKAVYIQHMNPNSKHHQGWRNRRWQVQTHMRIQKELEAWTP